MRPAAAAAAAALAAAALAALGAPASAAPLWPVPLNQTTTGRTLELDARRFRFVAIGADSDVLRAAFDRYDGLVFGPSYYAQSGGGPDEGVDADAAVASSSTTDRLTSLRVYVSMPDQSLNVHTDESYALSISDEGSWDDEDEGEGGDAAAPADANRKKHHHHHHHKKHHKKRASRAVASIQATTVYGAVRALETFAQLVTRVDDPPLDPGWGSAGDWDDDDDENADPLTHRRHPHRRRRVGSARFYVPAVSIYDEPRYAHRGTLLDTARHYLPLPTILAHLDAMAASKLNVLHWHATDDAAFSVDIPGAPELAARGNPDGRPFYTAADVAAVVAAARDRGIRVIPEIDAPSHAASWGGAYPGALVDCVDGDGHPAIGRPPPLDPSQNGTYALLWRVLRGASALFPESKLHVGGDEVDTQCWANDPAVKAWAAGRDWAAIAAEFTSRAVALVSDLGRDAIVWQEAFDGGAVLPPRTEVAVWQWWKAGGGPSDAPDPAAWRAALGRVVAAGHRAILAAPYYLNLEPRGDQGAWRRLYNVDPRAGIAPHAAAARVIGGEACLWGEMIDAANLLPTAWPGAAVVGERLWSGAAPPAADDGVAARLAVHVCRLRARGVPAGPLGPGWCPGDAAEEREEDEGAAVA